MIAAADNLVALVVATALAGYLLVVLFRPERF